MNNKGAKDYRTFIFHMRSLEITFSKKEKKIHTLDFSNDTNSIKIYCFIFSFLTYSRLGVWGSKSTCHIDLRFTTFISLRGVTIVAHYSTVYTVKASNVKVIFF